MPEAPEVEALALFLRERLIGHEVVGVDLVEGRALKTRARPLAELIGRRVTAVTRFGKHIDLDLDGVHLALGFGRAGWATWQEAGAAEVDSAAAVIARIAFDDGILGITDAGEWLFRCNSTWWTPPMRCPRWRSWVRMPRTRRSRATCS
ncbi:formamidopyrimidine-DNA glycosylase [Microbacterium testaceum]|uniref:DNA-formamidopyrimidine glycosylase family protein n=1 Tax=Microbacterium testaceum TaxID=2033 RepID=UPI0027879D3A|nr:DNA-formamidopyrimidine glycosylase family protein [Microbacterium testaceum]MDQ1174358.1 formamidopyrimidine-DNA glycosylase [Microbacterium testaceum]